MGEVGVRRIGLLAVLLLLVGAGAVSARPVTFTPSANNALIVIEAEPADDVMLRGASYMLGITAFAPDTHVLSNSNFHGWAGMSLGKNQHQRQYYLRTVAPGTYAFQAIGVQMWNVCFNGSTLAFTIRPGEALFLGRLDPHESLREIQFGVASGQMPKSGHRTDYFYLFDAPRPPLLAPENLGDWRPGLEAFLKSEHPGVTAQIQPAAYVETHFNTGRDLFGLQRVCGGYYAKGDAAPAAPPP